MILRYLAAIAILAVITGASFITVRSLIADMRGSEAVIAQAADLRSSIHKTMLALDALTAGEHQADMRARAEAETLRAGLDRLLVALSEAGASHETWMIVRQESTGLEASVRMLIERGLEPMRQAMHSAAATQGSHMPMAHSANSGGAQPLNEHASAGGMHVGHSPAMMSVDALIEHLRVEARAQQDWAGHLHDALGAGTLLILLIEAAIIFRPLMRKAETESARADQASSELEYLASHDALTGLLNRGQIDRILEVAVRDAVSQNTQLGLVLLDLDEFKPINDTLGHAAGDAVLTAVAERIRNSIGPAAIAGRLGGDEFIIILPGAEVEADVEALAERLLTSIRTPLDFAGQEISPKASIGYAVFPVAGNNVAAVLSAADLAMYAAKRAGRGRVSEFSEQMRAESDRARQTERALREGFASRQFEVYYQTINSADGEVSGVEALARWRHPERGLLGPDQFLPDLQRLGHMGALTEFVLNTALGQAVVWRAAGLLEGPVHVNIGADFLRNDNAPAQVRAALAAAGASPSDLVLEITEDVPLGDVKVSATIEALHQLGVMVAVDDFGVGNMSILDVKRPSIGMVKLDRALVGEADKSNGDMALLASLAAMCRSMDKLVIAEGVETAEMVELLRLTGLSGLQGYHFCRPSSAREVTKMLAVRAAQTQPAMSA
ncbi:MAG TPA: EAL domain-containing protein [Mesorhizobium sp.]|jgi:diguanylate cyclase (GGDEF)-like protein|nr:EAL domain-containing protein [Mesorhizobium sp.]